MPRLNCKLLLWTAGLALLVGVSVYLVHLFQTGRIAQALLWQARRAEQENRLAETDKFLSRYLELAPDDTQERANLGRVLANEKAAPTDSSRQRALFLLEQVVSREPDRQDSRRTLAHVALELGRYDLALEHLQALPQDGEVLYLLGQAHEAKRAYAQAAACYARAVEAAPDRIAAYERLADLLRRQPAATAPSHPALTPERVLDDLVAHNENSFRAHLARWQFLNDSEALTRWRALRESGAAADAQELEKERPEVRAALDKAASDVRRALELAPTEPDALLAAAEMDQLRGRFDTARSHLRKALADHPQNPRLYQALATLELRAGRRPEALACLRRAVKVLTGPGQNEVRWTLANVLLDGGDRAEVREHVAQLAKGGAAPAGVQYLQARLLVQEGKWAAAANLLEKARGLVEAVPDRSRDTDSFLGQVDSLLGQCYARLNDPSRQCAAYGRVAARDPSSASVRLDLARALWAAGRLDDARGEYRRVIALPGMPVEAWAEMARLLIARNLQEDRPDWVEVEQALDRAEQAKPGSVDIVLLRAEAYEAQDQGKKASQLLEEARARKPDRAEFPLALAALAQRRGERDRARRFLEEAKRAGGDTAAWRLASTRYWAGGRGPEAVAALARLEEGLTQYPPKDQALLLQGLAEGYYRLDRIPDALRLWTRLADQPGSRDDLRVQVAWVDLAVEAGDDVAARRALEAVRRLEGSQGSWWRYGEAERLVRRARQGDAPELDQARALLDEVAAQRPAWSAVPLAKAEIAVRKGNPEQAIAEYREAISLGENNPRVVRQLVQLLHQLQRYAEADQELQLLQKRMRLSGDLQRLAVDLALRNRNPAAALQLARDAVPAGSKDYRDYLWLGQVQAASGQRPDEAERNLRRAVELAEQAPETWVALVEFLASTNQKDRAEAEIARARARLGPEKAPLAVAQCYEALGRPERTREWYRKAVEAQPADVAVLRSAAAYALRTGRPAEAEPLLRKVLDRQPAASEADVAWARRNLAWALSAGGDWQRLPEALRLVGLSLDPAGKVIVEPLKPSGTQGLEEQRARAKVLAAQNLPALREAAIALFENLARGQTLTADDRFRLAQLYEAAGAWPQAREQYRTLAAAQANTPFYLARYAQALLRRHELDEAESTLDRLERLEKAQAVESGAFGSVELRASLLEARGKGADAIALLRPYVARQGAGAQDILLLVGCLARQGRLAEALDHCERAWKTCPPVLVGGTCLAVLRAARPGEEDSARVDRWLQAAIAKEPEDLVLLLQRAELCDLRQRYTEAEALYRQVLKKDGRNIVALNNLAWLLAQRSPGAAESRELITRAIECHGPRAELLSTRAMVDLCQDRPAAAIEYLEAATNQAPTPSGYFYLAAAHLKARNRDAAVQALGEATRRGFQLDQLHPLERESAQRVTNELQAR